MKKLIETQKTLLRQFATKPFYKRSLFDSFTFNNRISGLVGPRGVGKTTYLLKYVLDNGALEGEALYVSADNIYFLETSLLDLVDQLFKETNIRLLVVDEIHKMLGWQQQLKNIVDTYLDFKIIFTGSSQIDITRGKYDLSRRVTLYQICGLSFREYLEIKTGQVYPKLSIDEILSSHTSVSEQIQDLDVIKHFHHYLNCGYYPFYYEFESEAERYHVIENITQKIIYEDIGTFHSLKTPTLSLIEKLYKYVLNSAPGELSIGKLASSLGKDYTNVHDYLTYLEQAGLIRFIFSHKAGQAGLRRPTKLYPENSNLMYAAYLPIAEDNLRGKVRETFVINHFQNAAIPIFYNDKRDFTSNDIVLEIGGRNKTDKQLQNNDKGYMFKDGMYSGFGNVIPLFLLGLLY